ncbi:nuclear transport factor 2 family protein [Streptodolium elevatio]|uniref:Nuclear transport factor 2 family protein n=1 Tax=Streptodolium elevatio TaxID=3157996 RepID=A0ABV3DV40_9ACTN
MPAHDHLAAHQVVHRWWFNYDEGHLDVLAGLLAEDCHTSSRTETGQHPHEEFIRSDARGPEAVLAWTREHRRHSPYPLRHNAANVHVTAERGDEIDLESYLFVTQIAGRRPSTLSSGIVHFTLVRTDAGYLVRRKEVVLDSIESAPFHEVDFVADRQKNW